MGKTADLEPIRLSFKPVCRSTECLRPVERGVYCKQCLEDRERSELKEFTDKLYSKSKQFDRSSGILPRDLSAKKDGKQYNTQQLVGSFVNKR